MSSRKSRFLKLALALVFLSAFSGQNADAFTLQSYQKDKRVKVETVTLQQALEKLRNQGPEIIKLKSELQGFEETYRKEKYRYWMPTGSFEANLSSSGTVARYREHFRRLVARGTGFLDHRVAHQSHCFSTQFPTVVLPRLHLRQQN